MEYHLGDIVIVTMCEFSVRPHLVQPAKIDHVRWDISQTEQRTQPTQEVEVAGGAVGVGEDLEFGRLALADVDHAHFVRLVGRDVVQDFDSTFGCLETRKGYHNTSRYNQRLKFLYDL